MLRIKFALGDRTTGLILIQTQLNYEFVTFLLLKKINIYITFKLKYSSFNLIHNKTTFVKYTHNTNIDF